MTLFLLHTKLNSGTQPQVISHGYFGDSDIGEKKTKINQMFVTDYQNGGQKIDVCCKFP